MSKTDPAQGLVCMGFASFLVVFMLGAAGAILYFFAWAIFVSARERIFHCGEKARVRFLQLLDALGARQTEEPDLFRVADFPEYGVSLAYGQHRRGKGISPYLELTARSQSEGNFSIAPARVLGTFGGLLKKLGVIAGVNTPSPEFNARFHVASDSLASAGIYLSPAARQAAIEIIFSEGWQEIILEGAALRVRRYYFYPGEAAGTEIITRVLKPLADLANAS